MGKKKWLLTLFSVTVMGLSSCATANSTQGEARPVNRTPSLDANRRCYIYGDEHFHDFLPVSWMGAAPKVCSLDVDCPERPGAGSRCIRMKVFRWEPPYWAAVAWTVPGPNGKGKPYWGKEPAVGWNLTGASKLVFSARASQQCKIEVSTMAFGDQRYGDSSSFGLMQKVELAQDWKRFELDLAGEKNLSRVICGLVIGLNGGSTEAPISVWLDEIYFQFPSAEENAEPEPLSDSQGRVLYDNKHHGVSPVDWMPAEAGQMVLLDPAFKPKPTDKNTCIKMTLKEWRSPYWCAIAWVVDPENNGQPYWGDAPRQAWDLRPFDELHFRARADRRVKVQFKIGVLGDKPYGDSLFPPIETKFMEVDTQWKNYILKLKDKPRDLSRIVTPICVVWARDQQAETPVVLFLDDIKFVTVNEQTAEKR